MPKMKTKKAAAKRFTKTGTGKVRMYRAGTSHMLEGKTSKRKRHLRKNTIMSKGDAKRIESLLVYK